MKEAVVTGDNEINWHFSSGQTTLVGQGRKRGLRNGAGKRETREVLFWRDNKEGNQIKKHQSFRTTTN